MQKTLSLVRQAVEDYEMIAQGDKIAVGVSGGKDSMALLALLHQLSRFYPQHFTVCGITIDMGLGADFSPLAAWCQQRSIEYHIVPTEIAEVVFDIRKEPNPCSLCAKMRRGALHEAAGTFGCNKVALGHHQDDVLETFFLSLFYEGRLSCFEPVTYLSRANVTMIRPLIYCQERTIRGLAQREELPIVKNPCPVDGNTKRQDIKEHIAQLQKDYPDVKKLTFRALQRSPLCGGKWNIHPSHPQTPTKEG